MNLIVVDKCTNYCRYCFASTEMGRESAKGVLTRERIDTVLEFVRRSGPRFSINVIGGEPFLYADLGYLLDCLYAVPNFGEATVFTGGIFRAALLDRIASHAERTTILVNLNERRDYRTLAEYDLVLANMARAQELGFRVVVGFNIWRPDFDGAEILDVCHSSGIERLRWTVAYPEAKPSPGVVTLQPSEYPGVARRCAAFLETAYQRGVQAYLDCPLPKCFFEPAELGRLTLTHPGSVSAIRACGPVVDVSPDLTVFRCFALSGHARKSLVDFRDFGQVVAWYELEIDARYGLPVVYEACSSCEFAADRSCFGGCMAHSPSALGTRATPRELLARAHVSLVRGDLADAHAALSAIPGRDANAALLRSHVAVLENQHAEALRWARLALSRARSGSVRERASEMLRRLSRLSGPDVGGGEISP